MRVPVAVRGYLPLRSDLRTARLDLAALLTGYCNARSSNGNHRRSPGGYDHWRCTRRRGHTGAHRMHNYRWTSEQGSVTYDPIDRAEAVLAARRADTVDLEPVKRTHPSLCRSSWTQRIRAHRLGRQLMRERRSLRGLPSPTALTWKRGPIRIDLCPVSGPDRFDWDLSVHRIFGGRLALLQTPRGAVGIRWSRGADW